MSQTPENHCVVDFLRHGETSAGKCFLGSTDAALSERGWQQMEAAQVEEEYDLIISSPLLRCSEFARQYANKTAVPLKLESEFREINFGLWESRTSLELWQCDEEKLSAFWRDPVKHTPPEGEPLMDFKKRVLERYYSMLEENKGQKILLICHAGVIKVILCELLGMDINNIHKLTIDYAGISRVSMWGALPQVNFINYPPCLSEID